MKKNLNLIILCGSLFLAVLVFVFMAIPAVTANVIIGTAKASMYDLLGDYGGVLAAFILFLVGFLGGCCVVVIKLLNLKFDFAHFVAFGSALLLLVAGILFFCTASFVGVGSLAAGAVLCALLSIFAALGLCFYGALEGKLIKL